MKRKGKKIQLLTPEEKAARDERLQQLLRLFERGKIELATGKRPADDDPRIDAALNRTKPA